MIKPWIRVVTMGIFALGLSSCQFVETVGISSIDEKGNKIEGAGYTFTTPDGFLSVEANWKEIPRFAWISRK